MASGPKGSKKSKGKAKAKERQERRFEPRPTASAGLVAGLGGLGAAALGAGVFAQFGHAWMGSEAPPYPFAPALLAAGALGFGAAIWFGTSAEPVMRVGSGGVGFERAKEVVRIPWYGVERIVWEPGSLTLSVQGKDEAGREQKLSLSTNVHPGAIGWVVKEARARVPDVVDVPDEARGLPEAQSSDGQLLTMDPVQVVGKRCADSNRIIAYEPDARVCTRCERVYYKASVPETCACGASLASLRTADESAAAVPATDVAPVAPKGDGEPAATPAEATPAPEPDATPGN